MGTINFDNLSGAKTSEAIIDGAESLNGATHNFQADAPEPAPAPDPEAIIERLAKLKRAEYLSARKTKAKILDWPAKELDKLVEKQKKKARAHLKVVSNAPPNMFRPVVVGDWPSMSPAGPHANDIRNVKVLLDAAGVQLRYDTFTQKAVATFKGGDTVIDDAVAQRFWTMFQNSELRAALAFTHDAIMALSREIVFDSAIDFFNSLPKWDGIRRAETLFIVELGAEDTPYTRGAARLLFASIVRRGMGRESKCDEFVILRGAQGIGKSTLLKILIGEQFYQENLKMNHSTRELLELTLGKLVVEMAELSGIRKTEREDVKTFFSKTHDEFSLKHEKHATSRQRRFTFIGTANDEAPIANLLKEDRRFIFLPVNKRADLDRIKRDRLQILAEAIEIEKNYGPILELPKELWDQACDVRAEVAAKPEYDEILEETFGDIVSAKITVSDVYAFLGFRDKGAIGKYTKATGQGITPIMERLGWKQTQLRKGDDRPKSFIKGDGAGWLRVSWPHGAMAPAEIEPDYNPDDPYWYKGLTEEGGDKGLTEGRDAKNPCGSSASAAVNTCQHLSEEIIQENSLSPLERDSDIEERERPKKVWDGKVLTEGVDAQKPLILQGNSASTPVFEAAVDGGLCGDGCRDYGEC